MFKAESTNLLSNLSVLVRFRVAVSHVNNSGHSGKFVTLD